MSNFVFAKRIADAISRNRRLSLSCQDDIRFSEKRVCDIVDDVIEILDLVPRGFYRGSISVKIDEQGNQISENQYKANEVQIGGEHYRTNGKHQIWDLVVDMGWDFFQGNAISYIHRYRQKGGVDDLRKARHYLDKMIEIEEAKKSEGEKS